MSSKRILSAIFILAICTLSCQVFPRISTNVALGLETEEPSRIEIAIPSDVKETIDNATPGQEYNYYVLKTAHPEQAEDLTEMTLLVCGDTEPNIELSVASSAMKSMGTFLFRDAKVLFVNENISCEGSGPCASIVSDISFEEIDAKFHRQVFPYGRNVTDEALSEECLKEMQQHPETVLLAKMSFLGQRNEVIELVFKPGVVVTPIAEPSDTAIAEPTMTPSPEPTQTPEPKPKITFTPEPGRVYEPEGGFSYLPPEGWKVIQAPGFDYKVISGIQTGDFVPNLFFYVNQAHSGTLDEFVSGSLEHNETILEDLEIVSQEDFFTSEGKRGVKVINENTQRNMRVRQTSYYFEAGAMKFVATYTRLADKGQSNDILIDQSMKTFQPESIPGGSPGTHQETTAPSKQVILIANPNCPAPKITSADEIIVRVRWGATTAEVAASNADHFTFTFLVDGEDKDDIRPYRQPAESYSSLERYDCGSGETLAWVHWDVPIGGLPSGTHTVSINYILDQAISDGMEEYPAGPFGFLEIGFDVLP